MASSEPEPPAADEARIAPQIAGGEPDRYSDVGWVASLAYRKLRHKCGGSLVSSRFVLTAAHCTDWTLARSWTVRLRSKDSYRGGVVRKVRRIIHFPGYQPGYTEDGFEYGDMALLRLKRRVSVKPVRLVGRGVRYVESQHSAYIAGWGARRHLGPGSRWLRSAWIPLQDDSVCLDWNEGESSFGRKYGDVPGFNGEAMLCAGDGSSNTCRGDSGGPLAVRAGGRWLLLGVTSFGPDCDISPGAYAWVGATPLRQWLHRRLGV